MNTSYFIKEIEEVSVSSKDCVLSLKEYSLFPCKVIHQVWLLAYFLPFYFLANGWAFWTYFRRQNLETALYVAKFGLVQLAN